MTRIDLYLERPINILGEGGTSYPNTIHINTTTSGDEYIEDTDGEILYLSEMDSLMVANVQSIVEQNS
jgi:hypothetical protein